MLTTAADRTLDELNRSGLRRFGVVVLCAKVVVVPLIFDVAADASFTVPKALTSHALSYVLLGVMVGLLVQFRQRLVGRSDTHAAVIAFLAVSALATVFAVDLRLAVFGSHVRMLGLGTIADWVILYFGVALLIRTKTEILAVLGAVVATTIPVLAYEAVQLSGKDPLRWTMDSASRPFSTLGQPTTLGAYLAIVSAGTLVFGLVAPNATWWQRVALVVWSIALFIGAVESGTRAVVLGVIAALMTTALLVGLRAATSRAKLFTAIIAAIAAVILALVVALAPLAGRIADTFVGPGSTNVELDPSTAGRLDLYAIAAGIVKERPLLGYGPDGFTVGVPKYRPEGASFLIRQSLATSPHGWIPYLLTSSGILGLVAFLWMLATGFRTALKASAEPVVLCAAAMAAAFLGTGLVTIDDVGLDWLLWLCLGLISCASGTVLYGNASLVPQGSAKVHHGNASVLPRARRARQTRRPPAAARVAGPIAAAVSLATIVLAAPAWSASRDANSSEDLRLIGHARKSIEAGLDAVHTDGGRAEYWHTLGLGYVSAQRFADARSAFDNAVRLAPQNIAYVSDEIQAELVLAAAGDQTARIRALTLSEQAVRTDPNNPRAQLLRASTLLATGDTKSAEGFARRALALDPGSANELLYVTALQILAANGHTDEAIDVARSGITLIAPHSVGLRVELARVLISAGRLREALNELDQVLTIRPDLAVALQLRQQVQAQLR